VQERQNDKDQSLAKTVSQYIITSDNALHGCGGIGPWAQQEKCVLIAYLYAKIGTMP
jgi:hypothetical protein